MYEATDRAVPAAHWGDRFGRLAWRYKATVQVRAAPGGADPEACEAGAHSGRLSGFH